jgi:hypothetical protein
MQIYTPSDGPEFANTSLAQVLFDMARPAPRLPQISVHVAPPIPASPYREFQLRERAYLKHKPLQSGVGRATAHPSITVLDARPTRAGVFVVQRPHVCFRG